MPKTRVEAFSDAVIAIIITIMVLEMHPPHTTQLSALAPLVPVFASYVLSFLYIGIYWNNHHHLLQAVQHVDGRVLWANLVLLFWLSLLPFATGWMGENAFAPMPVALYGLVLLMAAISWEFLVQQLISLHGRHSIFAAGRRKRLISTALYIVAVALALVESYVSLAIYFLVAAMWFIPDRRIERMVGGE